MGRVVRLRRIVARTSLTTKPLTVASTRTVDLTPVVGLMLKPIEMRADKVSKNVLSTTIFDDGDPLNTLFGEDAGVEDVGVSDGPAGEVGSGSAGRFGGIELGALLTNLITAL